MAITKTYEDGTMNFNNGTPDILGGGLANGGLAGALIGALAGGALAGGALAGGGTAGKGISGGGFTIGAIGKNENKEIFPELTEKPTVKEEEEKKPEPTGPIIAPDIQDKTEENVETTINGSGLDYALKWAEEQQKAQWEREDTIRRETQEREDTAYQRAVADMRAAGINPNLVGVDPAASGGGITSATGQNLQMYQAEMNKYLQELDQMFQENFKGDENDKDRFMDLISSAIQLYSVLKMFSK